MIVYESGPCAQFSVDTVVSRALGVHVDKVQLASEWVVGDPIGGGGFGKVYEASSADHPRAAIKLVPKVPGAQRELLLADVSNARNVVPIIDSGESGDNWAIVMPRAERSLRDYLTGTSGPLGVKEAVAVLADVAAALSDLDGRVVHRDLKPENVLLLAGHWCLADFGISRYAEATTAPDTRKYSLTPEYAAPERWRAERATTSTDVYSLGILLTSCSLASGPSRDLNPKTSASSTFMLTRRTLKASRPRSRLWWTSAFTSRQRHGRVRLTCWPGLVESVMTRSHRDSQSSSRRTVLK